MHLRKSTKQDIKVIMKMIKQAQKYLGANNIDQWQNGYPDETVIQTDIDKGESYVLEIDAQIVASSAISFDEESTYNEIFNGEWLSIQPYAVVHRIVVDTDYKGKGIASEILKAVEERCLSNNIRSIKIDTHNDNISMQRLLLKNNYTRCGDIKLDDGSPRIAFEKLI